MTKKKKFKLPSKAIVTNKRKKTININESVYYDNLPKGISVEDADAVHDYDDQFLATALTQGADIASGFKGGKALLTISTPTGVCSTQFDEDTDPMVVVQTDYGSDTAVGKAIAMLTKLADQKVN